MTAERRRGFTLIEIAFVMTIACIIMMILFEMLSGVTGQVSRGQDTLDFLRQATILLDTVKGDIRGAGRGRAIEIGPVITIKREGTSKGDEIGAEQVVTYEFNPEKRTVTRTVKGGGDDSSKVHGLAGGGLGFITTFEIALRQPRITVSNGVTSREIDVRGFYEVKLAYASEQEIRSQPGGKPRAVHTFRTLVSKRAPELTDDLWKANGP